MNKITFLLSFFIIQQAFSQNTFPPTGNVGIGTTTPDVKLNVVGNINIDNVDWATDNELRIREGGSNSYGAFFKYGLNDILAIGTRHIDIDYPAMQISRGSLNTLFNGNVGIGIANPSMKLEVIGNENLNFDAAGFFNAKSFGNVNDKCETRINLGKIEGNIRRSMGAIGAFPSNNTDSSNGILAFYTRESASLLERLRIIANGNVGIGLSNPTNKLDVNGTIHSKEVKVDMNGWSDFVFKKDYDLPTLEEVEKHIAEKGHLENIPSEEEVLKNGINLGEMNTKLLQKIEELTLYMIELKKENMELKNQNESFKVVFERLSKIEEKLK
ncbi:hypothetical protein [Flavobacterium sp. 2]|uniref:hypothetical protein n=1 Tax=Flavobacterium sp. 2 TaxID=308053 RepID=UPI003CEF4C82